MPYWDVVVVTLRKLILLTIVVHARDTGAVVQALLALLLIMICLALHLRKHPYDSDILDKHEMYTLMASGITLILGIGLTVLADSAGATDDGLISSMVVLTSNSRERWQLCLVCVVLGINAAVICSFSYNIFMIAWLSLPKVCLRPPDGLTCLHRGWLIDKRLWLASLYI